MWGVGAVLEMMVSEGFHQSVTKPTRIAGSTMTLIDHVYLNTDSPPQTNIIMAGLSDHEITLTTLSKIIKIKKEFVTKRWLKSPDYDSIAL